MNNTDLIRAYIESTPVPDDVKEMLLEDAKLLDFKKELDNAATTAN
jgi:hypothetical protein